MTTATAVSTIDRAELEAKLRDEKPNNHDPERGWALVNVLDEETFADQHIPDSINIPGDSLDRFEKRFAKSKEIVVYCASPDCEASPRAAQALAERGFTDVAHYPGGMERWRAADNRVAEGAA